METSQTNSRWLIVAWYTVVYQSRYSDIADIAVTELEKVRSIDLLNFCFSKC